MKKLLKHLLNNRLKNEKGLTLVELLAVIVILGIVAAIAVPAVGNIINNSKDRAILGETANLLAAAKIAVTDNACGPDTTCINTELDNYYDGTLVGTDQVSWADTNGNRVYTITYSELGKIKDFAKFGLTSGQTVITDSVLMTALEK